MRDAAVLSAIEGQRALEVRVGKDGRPSIFGIVVALSVAEVPDRGIVGRAFLESLVGRGMRGVWFITSDDHAGLDAARKTVLGGAMAALQVPSGSECILYCGPTAAIRKRPDMALGQPFVRDLEDLEPRRRRGGTEVSSDIRKGPLGGVSPLGRTDWRK